MTTDEKIENRIEFLLRAIERRKRWIAETEDMDRLKQFGNELSHLAGQVDALRYVQVLGNW